MYSGRIQILAIAGSVLLTVFILVLIRKRRLKEEYSLLWLFCCFIFLVLSIWRGGIDWFARVVGIAYAPAALFLILLMAVFIIMIEFSLIISQIANINKHLAQDVGILKEEMEELKEELKSEIQKNKETPNNINRAADNT